MANVEFSIQLLVGKVDGTVQEQPGGPCVVAQKAFGHVHFESLGVDAADRAHQLSKCKTNAINKLR